MRPLAEGGPFVLAPMPCSQRRREYFQRANRIIATYVAVTAYSGQGQKAIEAGTGAGKVGDSTPIRIVLGDHTLQTTYKMIKSAFAKAGAQLTNQMFLMLYGNFEAFLADLARDALAALGSSEPLEEAVTLVAMTKWRGKLDRIVQRFSLTLGHKRYVAAYEGIDMQVLGKTTADPVEFLSHSRPAASLGPLRWPSRRTAFGGVPQSGLADGALIELPFGLPSAMHFWFVPLTDLLDEAFSTTFGWTRETTSPDQLIDEDLRIA